MNREEALKIVRDLYEKSLFLKKDKEAIETLIPELNESEDERIRKALLRCCYDWDKGQSSCIAKKDVPAIRAYLEKQKEQKPATDKPFEDLIDGWYNMHHRDGYITMADKSFEDWIDGWYNKHHRDGYITMDECEFKNWSRGIRNMNEQKDYRKLYEDIAKSEWFKKAYEGKSLGCDDEQKEQKTVEWSEEEDERIRKEIIQFFKDAANSKTRVVNSNTFAEWATYLEKQKEQKPVKLNDDTEVGLDRALQIVKGAKGNLCGYQSDDGIYECDHAIQTLERILKNGIEQHAAEWSEEDKGNLLAVKCIIDEVWRNQDVRKEIGHSGEELESLWHWLDNIWQKVEYPQPKQEWSKEDEDIINEVAPILAEKIQSLRPQPKQESEPMEIKFAGKIYKVHETKELPGGVVGYIIEDKPGHYDCIIHPDEVLGGGYGIKSNGSPSPTKEANFGQSHWKPSEKKYDGNMDKECIKLCDILNSIQSIDTFESCCGHLKNRYSIWFFCNDIITISRLGRCVERNYSDGGWELLVDSTDTQPTGVFWLRSKIPFQSYDEMEKSVNELCNCIQFWFDTKFDSYFNCNICEETTKKEEHWKPSEEQMRAVFDASERNDKLGSVLSTLYNDLKKL